MKLSGVTEHRTGRSALRHEQEVQILTSFPCTYSLVQCMLPAAVSRHDKTGNIKLSAEIQGRVWMKDV